MFYCKLKKLLALMRNRLYFNRLAKYGVAAGIEHERMLCQMECSTIVDIGANRGQFALVARSCLPRARIISFEPLPGPAARYCEVFADDRAATLHRVAIGPTAGETTIHISNRDDSSSLFPITDTQDALFPGTREAGLGVAKVGPLDAFISGTEIESPALLKLDVQGFELQALEGCSTLLSHFEWIYAECSFVELYSGQALADEVIAWLRQQGFGLVGVYNMSYDDKGRSIQADFLFKAASKSCAS